MMDTTIIIEKSVIIFVVFAITMLMAMYSTWAERKVAAWLQDRVGPNRAGPLGLFQPLADGLKLFSKEEFELFEKMYNSATKKRLESVNPNYLSSYNYLLKNN